MSLTEQISERLDEVEKGYAIEGQGLRVLRPLSKAEWESLGNTLGKRLTSQKWAIADWINYGEDVVGPIVVTRETYWGALARITGLSEKTLMGYARVGRCYPLAKRIQGASFSRHRDAIVLDGMARRPLLRQSVVEGWSEARWFEALAKAPLLHPENGRTGGLTRGKSHAIKAFLCPHCQGLIPRAAILKFVWGKE